MPFIRSNKVFPFKDGPDWQGQPGAWYPVSRDDLAETVRNIVGAGGKWWMFDSLLDPDVDGDPFKNLNASLDFVARTCEPSDHLWDYWDETP